LFGDKSKSSAEYENEKFIYKTMIESTINIKDLWFDLFLCIKNELMGIMNLSNVKITIDYIKELYGLHRQLHNINFQTIFKKVDKNAENEHIEKIDKENRISLLLTEIDGVINRLEYLFKEKMLKNRDPISSVNF
jgi:hypothetical protein